MPDTFTETLVYRGSASARSAAFVIEQLAAENRILMERVAENRVLRERLNQAELDIVLRDREIDRLLGVLDSHGLL